MPLYDFECNSCGKPWDDFRPSTDLVAGPCPECKSEDTKKVLSKVSFKMFKSIEDYTPDQIEGMRISKKWIEDRAEDWASGKLIVEERGPKELRPVMPDHLKKIVG
jgi:putative FmdB family regulatory protein